MAITVQDTLGKDVVIEGLDSTRQPKFTTDEIADVKETFLNYGPYSDGDYSAFFRVISDILPHRTLSIILSAVYHLQVTQELPYYGKLPRANAKERDAVNMVTILQNLAKWKAQQEEEKKAAKKSTVDTSDMSRVEMLLMEQNTLMLAQNKILSDIHKFVAGTYRRATGDDGKFMQVELMAEPEMISLTEALKSRLESMDTPHARVPDGPPPKRPHDTMPIG